MKLNILFENQDEVIKQIDAWIAKQYQKQVYSNPLDDMDDEFGEDELEDELFDLIKKLNRPYPPIEPYIKNNPKYAYYYARDIIKGRWPEGEDAIKQDVYYAYHYAEGVIKGRWPEGEDAIKQDAEYWNRYKKL